jgi:hypothetical protein
MDYKEANRTLLNQEPPIRIRVKGEECHEWQERIPVKFKEDGSAICVVRCCEEEYLQGEEYDNPWVSLLSWDIWETIPEDKEH